MEDKLPNRIIDKVTKDDDLYRRFDRFIERNWKPYLCGFGTLALWNILRWLGVI